jgi:hypothetical protein
MGAPNSAVGYTSSTNRRGGGTNSIWTCGGTGEKKKIKNKYFIRKINFLCSTNFKLLKETEGNSITQL